ncbi:MAG: DASS family sodium-coupled anion symporter [Myxococcales bacterium]|nr:DASS family sodium-coupled anion symporter [Myxococcales bacterium]MBK7191871.1 DASS family sodium-coupled anion symporter [Myxococcales bacterium]MBP6842885.1 DASS family sodium-coupled anion symporter [Kofleriaceae bacterium]
MTDAEDVSPDLPDDVPGARFERRKRAIGLVAAPSAAVLVAILDRHGPAPALTALMTLAIGWWLTEALPAAAVALVVAALAVVLDLAPPKVAFAAFGSPLLFMFVGAFFVAEAMKVHGLGDRLAAAASRLARGPRSLVIALSGAAFVLSAFMSNAAATAIILPIALAAAAGTSPRYQAAMVLAIAWAASMGGLATPVGTPPNLIGLGQLRAAGVDVGFTDWVMIAAPIAIAMLIAMWLVLFAVFGVRREAVTLRAPAQPRWRRGEVSIAIALTVAVLGWLAPSLVELLAPGAAARWTKAHVTEEVVAILAGGLLFVLPGGAPGKPRPALTWDEATRIDWGVVLLFGGGILLGDLARSTGLTDTWGRALVAWTGASSTWAVVALCIGVAIVLSEATSNTATATLMAPLAIGLANATHTSPVAAVLGATIGASFGFMMPISTAPNALAYGTGRVTMGQMMRAGIIFDVVGFVVVWLGLRVALPLFGWG